MIHDLVIEYGNPVPIRIRLSKSNLKKWALLKVYAFDIFHVYK